MKYFYDDPLAAAWMEDRFGMNFQLAKAGVIDNISASVGNFILTKELTKQLKITYYIHPDSLHLLEPQVGDIGHDADYEGRIGEVITITEIKQGFAQSMQIFADNYQLSGDFFKIIQRNGIPFMWPEVE